MTEPRTQETRYAVSDAAEFGRVAVMLGGNSSERDVSLDSGAAVLEALQARGVDAHGWDPAQKTMSEFAAAGFGRVWIALHGPGGEDGALQGALQWLNIPYTGSGVMASAIAMDKVRSKHLFLQAGIPTPDFRVVRDASDVPDVVSQLAFPLIVKPSGQGSSVGMAKAVNAAELERAIDDAVRYDDTVLVEPCIEGRELTVAVLQGEALPSVEIVTPRVFYDYRAKYESERTEYRCPGNTLPGDERRYAEMAVAAFEALGCRGWGRVDFMAGADGQPQVLEVNTVPGMTSHSLVPMSAAAADIDFAALCWRILETSFDATCNEHGQKAAAHGA